MERSTGDIHSREWEVWQNPKKENKLKTAAHMKVEKYPADIKYEYNGREIAQKQKVKQWCRVAGLLFGLRSSEVSVEEMETFLDTNPIKREILQAEPLQCEEWEKKKKERQAQPLECEEGGKKYWHELPFQCVCSTRFAEGWMVWRTDNPNLKMFLL